MAATSDETTSKYRRQNHQSNDERGEMVSGVATPNRRGLVPPREIQFGTYGTNTCLQKQRHTHMDDSEPIKETLGNDNHHGTDNPLLLVPS